MSTEINIKKKLAILEEGVNITTDALSIDFVGAGVSSSDVGGNTTITIPGGSGTTSFYLNQSVTQSPYKEFSSVVTSVAEQTVPFTVAGGATTIVAEFQTPTGIPGTIQIPPGLWQFFLHFNAGAVSQNWVIRPTVYKRDLGGIETLLFTPDPEIVTNMSTTTTMYVSDGVFPATTLLASDRIVVKISMENTTGVSQTATFRTEGSQHYSVGLTTLNQVVPNNAVTNVTGTAPIQSSGGTTPAISITQASGSTNGYLSSSDFAIFNAKVPATRNITINGNTQDLSADRTWTIATSIPQAQIIYVDSANGVNAATGRGDINTPYLTPEYALSNTTNTGTITGNTATNTTLSAISDVDNVLLEIGMYVSGSGIPFGTIIVAKGNQGGNANTVTLSKLTTATATGITVTWVKTYNVILSGSFVVASSLFKEGMYIDAQSAEISWGAFTLFNINTYVNKIPYYILGQGNYFGTSISSVFILTNATQSQGYSLSITFGNIETIGTSYCIYLISGSNENYINIVGNFLNARFGIVSLIDGGTSSLTFNSYGLLGGFSFGFLGLKRLLGTHTTPASISVLSSGYGTQSLANLTGSTTWTGQSSHRGYINGTTHNIVGSLVDFYSTGGGGTITANGLNTITAVTSYTLNVGGTCSVYGSANYILSAISGILYFYAQADAGSISGAGVINNYGYIYVISMPSFTGTFNNYGTVVAGSFGGGGNVNNYGSITMIYYGIGVAANKTFVNRGTIISNGSLLNSNAIITLNNATGTFENYGSIINNTTDITKAVIEKTAGKLYLRQGSYLKVANGKSPIKCTANTSASKDVYYFGVTDNCDGTTYGLSIAFDGTSFAPNDLVGGTVYENINY